jgi:aspartyl protease family protein
MKASDIFQLLVVAGAIAAIVSVVLAPRLDDAAKARAGGGAASALADDADAGAASPARSSSAASQTALPYGDAAILKREEDGHYWALANLDGQFVKVMVDTGASTVALTQADARKIGLKPETLSYEWTIRTAGGEVKGAAVTLKQVKIGNVRVQDVDAMVLREGLEQSLLGMTFLGELYSYEFKGENLIIRK